MGDANIFDRNLHAIDFKVQTTNSMGRLEHYNEQPKIVERFLNDKNRTL